MPDQLDPSLDELATPQQPLYPKGVREQQRVSAPIGSMLGDLVKQFNDQIGQTMLSSDPTRVDDPGAYGAADLARQTLGGGYMGAPLRRGVGIWGGKLYSQLSPQETRSIDAWLKNQSNLNEYFSGMYNPGRTKFNVFDNGDFEVGAPLFDNNKQFVGHADRKIFPRLRKAYHGSLSIEDYAKSRGYGKQLSLAHFNTYQKTGINNSNLLAVEDGSSFWAHLGYLPNRIEWENVIKPGIRDNMQTMSGFDPNTVEKILRSSDPRAIWDIADLPEGKQLLYDVPWHGSFDMNNAEQVERMNINARKR
jgi:hypothetical protein